MAGNIKGITIEIGGNTAPLDKALQGVNKTSQELQAELRQVEKLLKLDPENVELLEQKQKLLTDAVGNTSEKLDTLKVAQKQVQKQFEEGKVSEEQFRALQREIIKTEQELEKLEDKGKKANDALTPDKAIGNLKSIGTLAAGAVVSLGAAAVGTVEGTRELRQELSILENNSNQAGGNIEKTNEALKNLNAISDDGGANVEALSNLLQAGFTDDNLATLVDDLSGAVLKFPDTLKIEGLADGLQETLATGAATGSFGEMLERMGVNLDTFNAGLAEASKNGEESNYIMQELGKLGLADVNEAYREQNASLIENANAQNDLKMATAELGGMLEPIVVNLTVVAAELLGKLALIGTWMQNNQTTVSVIAIVVGTLTAAIVAFNVAAAWGAITTTVLTTATAAFGAVLAFVTSPITLVILAIGALIAAGVLLYKNWDTVKAWGEKIWNGIVETFNKVIGFVKNNWQALLLFIVSPFATGFKLLYDNCDGFRTFIDGFVAKVVGFFKTLPDKIWNEIKKVVIKLGNLQDDMTKWVTTEMPKFILKFVTFFSDLPGDLLGIGKDIIKGLWNGMTEMDGWLKDKVKGFAKGIVSGIKDALQIKSPSRVFADEVGKYMAQGIGTGFEGEMTNVSSNMAKAIPTQGSDYIQNDSSNSKTTSGSLITGNNFYVREENDIKKIAKELLEMQTRSDRGLGWVG